MAVPGRVGEITAIFLQGFVGALRVLIRDRLVAAHCCDCLLELGCIQTNLLKQLAAAAIILCQCQQQMFDGDVAVAELILQLGGLVERGVDAATEKDRIGW